MVSMPRNASTLPAAPAGKPPLDPPSQTRAAFAVPGAPDHTLPRKPSPATCRQVTPLNHRRRVQRAVTFDPDPSTLTCAEVGMSWPRAIWDGRPVRSAAHVAPTAVIAAILLAITGALIAGAVGARRATKFQPADAFAQIG